MSLSENDCEEKYTIRQSTRDSVYFAAKDGLSIAMYSLLTAIGNEIVQNSVLNQVILLFVVFNLFLTGNGKSALII